MLIRYQVGLRVQGKKKLFKYKSGEVTLDWHDGLRTVQENEEEAWSSDSAHKIIRNRIYQDNPGWYIVGYFWISRKEQEEIPKGLPI